MENVRYCQQPLNRPYLELNETVLNSKEIKFSISYGLIAQQPSDFSCLEFSNGAFMSEDVSGASMDPFQNPELKPLEDVKLIVRSEGVSQSVPALNPHWIEKRYFLCYTKPQLYKTNGAEIPGAKEQWLEIVDYILEDLEWLLSLPHYRFWSNILYQKSIQNTLTSFLQQAPPFYLIDNFPNVPEMRSALDKLFHIVLLIYARLVTTEETPENYMTPTFHGEILYNNYIITIPALLDLSQLYGRGNAKIVERIIKNLFEIQPLYNRDLKQFIAFLLAMLRGMEMKFDDRRVVLPGNVIRISETKGSSSKMKLASMENFALSILDIFSTVTVFLDNYPPAAKLFHRDKVTGKIISFYGNTVPEIYNKLVELAYKDDCIEKYLKLKHLLDVTRIEILKFYRALVYSTIKEIIEDASSLTEVDIRSRVDEYLNLITGALSEKMFINDYHRHYPVDLDIDILQQTCPKFDLTRCEFILQSVCAGEKEMEKILKAASDNDTAVAGPSKLPETKVSTSTRGPSTSKSNNSDRTEVELMSLISEVKDILNHLEEGYIQRCLKHYNYDTASVINAVLEDSVPIHLKEANSDAPEIPPDPEEASAAADLAIGAQRLNVFDNDEFDIMTRDVVDTSRIHRGKRKDKYKNLNDLLNDKSHSKNLKDKYAKYSMVSDDYDDDYDDEYDDTYDSHDAGLNARDLSTEPDVRPFTTPRIFLTREKTEAASEEEEEESEDESAGQTQNGKDQFIQDPAELRARREERWQSKRGGRGGTTQSNRKEVFGKPKGQNNRRTAAEWKRRQVRFHPR